VSIDLVRAIPAPYMMLGVASLVAASMGFGYVKGAQHEALKAAKFEAATEALGKAAQTAKVARVSILAPRCRGAHRFARNRRKSRTFRHAFREPVLEPFSVLPLDTQSTNVVLKIQILACNANLPAFSCELGVRATGHHLLQHERPIKIGGLENPVLPDFAAS
jgi:hypothetical protein